MDKITNIELHQSEIDKRLGIELKRISDTPQNSLNHLGNAHRDDHYIFFIQEKGITELMIDFHNYSLINQSICYISPGQVHNYTKQSDVEGWFIFLETDMISNDYREIFDTYENLNQTTTLKENPCLLAVQLLEKQLEIYKNDIDKNIINSIVNSIIGMIASEFFQSDENNIKKISRKNSLTSNFKKKIRENFLNLKKPKEYASLLNVSVPYLNEVIKEQTGYSPSYWIKQEILLEAKRLLYYTQKDSKEIAFSLQYEDYAYFSRFFKLNVGITPIEFRNRYLDLSNHST